MKNKLYKFPILEVTLSVFLGLTLGLKSESLRAAVITNDTIQLGVNEYGNLIVPGTVPSSETGTTLVGLRFLPNNAEGLGSGCLCEGWGIADIASGSSGYANEEEGGAFSLTLDSFSSTARTATSQVSLANFLTVTHDFHPALATPYLYQIDITVENKGNRSANLQYRRVFDWDVDPTTFNEFVTIQGTASDERILFASDNGFASANPLSDPGAIAFVGDEVDFGSYDGGGLFDINLGEINPERSRKLTIYYGAAPSEAKALEALRKVNARTYSFGQPNVINGPDEGIPNTYIFAISAVPEPRSLLGSMAFGISSLVLMFKYCKSKAK